jgi:hypothetical protein
VVWTDDGRIHKPLRIVGFRLSRAEAGRTEIHLIGDNGNCASLSRAVGVYPASFADARRWVATWAPARGLTLEEIFAEPRLPRTPKGGVPESWLRSDDPLRAAKAALCCQSPAQQCSSTGRCEYGDCGLVIGK